MKEDKIQAVALEFYNSSDEVEKDKLKNKLANLCIGYYKDKSLNSYNKYEEAFYDALAKCINEFNPERGEFLHLLNKILKMEKESYKFENEPGADGRHNIKLKSNWKELEKTVLALGRNPEKWKDVLDIGTNILGFSEREIKKMYQLSRAFTVPAEISPDDGDENISLIDSSANVSRKNMNQENDPLNNTLRKDEFEIVDKLYMELIGENKSFNKDLNKKVLTFKLFPLLQDYTNDEVFEYSFVDRDLYNALMKEDISQKSICNQLGVDNSSFNRTAERFWNKLKKRMDFE